MPVSLARPRRPWLVVFQDGPRYMRIVAVEPVPADADAYEDLRNHLTVACLSAYEVHSGSAAEARRTARLLYDVSRIHDIVNRTCQHRPTPEARTHIAASTVRALARARQGIALTDHIAPRVEAILLTGLRTAWRYRPVSQIALTLDQYIQALHAGVLSALYQHAALVAVTRTDEAVAVLIHSLDNAAKAS